MILEKIVIVIGLVLAHFLNGSNLFELGPAIKPDFVFLFILFFAIKRGGLSGIWIGFLGGLLSDAGLGGEIGEGGRVYYKIGIHALSFCLVGYLVGKFARARYNENFISVSITIFLLTLVARVFTYLLFLAFFHPNQNYSFFSNSIYNAFIGPVTFFVLSWVYKIELAEETKPW
ncbi:MAG: rod shape-determining protein MreD [Leptospiraceae bacterium]|nr:rod shape-determining protein MreD [Leptospiraceae bacterium]